MNRVLAGACLAALCTAAPAAAADPSQGQSLAQAFAAAQSARLSVRIAVAERDAATARVAKARAQQYPTLDFSTNVDRIDNKDTFSGVAAAVEIPGLDTPSRVSVTQSVPRYQSSAALVVRYNAYTGGRVEAQLRHEELSLQAAELSHRMALQQVAVDVSFSYFKLRRACLLVASAARQLRYAESEAEVTGQRLREGRVAAIDERVSALELAEKQSAWRSRQADLALAYARFQEAVHDAPQAPAADGERCRFQSAVDADLEHARQLSDPALDEQHDSLKLEAARTLVSVQRAALRPQLNLYANYAGVGRSDVSLGNSISRFASRQSSVGVQLNFNIFDHGLAEQQVSQAQAEARKQALQAELAAADREQSKRRRDLRAQMAQTRIELLRSRLGLVTAQADMVRQQLAHGTVTAGAAAEKIERERDARDELEAAQFDAVLATLAALFPARTLPEP